MTQNNLINEYFEWMYQLIYDNRICRRAPYGLLLRSLYDKDFSYTIALDGNRAEDGVNLRYRFGYEHNYPDAMIAAYLDDRPCSVLEMLIALALRCEKHIMDSDEGDRTGQWFWDMIENLGLLSMNNYNFNKNHVDRRIDIFLNREYERDGKGGLFTVEHPRRDLRCVEIWYQMCWYLDGIQNK